MNAKRFVKHTQIRLKKAKPMAKWSLFTLSGGIGYLLIPWLASLLIIDMFFDYDSMIMGGTMIVFSGTVVTITTYDVLKQRGAYESIDLAVLFVVFFLFLVVSVMVFTVLCVKTIPDIDLRMAHSLQYIHLIGALTFGYHYKERVLG